MVKVGFIGLGAMGLPMTKNILKAGYDTYVFSRSRGPIEEVSALGAKECSTPKELIQTVDLLLTCLPFPQTVIDIYEGEEGIVAGASDGKIVIGHETISPELNKRLSGQLAAKGTAYMDAPISGGPKGAAAGTLTIICGGNESVFAKSLNVLKSIGENIVHAGQTGSGSTIKIINNMLIGIHIGALVEAYDMGEKAGVDLQMLYNIVKTSSGFSRAMDYWGVEDITERKKVDVINIKMLHKDLGLAMNLAESLGASAKLVQLSGEIVGDAD